MRVLEYVRQRNVRDTAYRYQSNELYDFLVRRLFKDRLHQDAAYEIVFARRGKSDRTAALSQALQAARQRFARQWGKSSVSPLTVNKSDVRGLQAADYFVGFATAEMDRSLRRLSPPVFGWCRISDRAPADMCLIPRPP
jgi:hypothetical protein